MQHIPAQQQQSAPPSQPAQQQPPTQQQVRHVSPAGHLGAMPQQQQQQHSHQEQHHQVPVSHHHVPNNQVSQMPVTTNGPHQTVHHHQGQVHPTTNGQITHGVQQIHLHHQQPANQ